MVDQRNDEARRAVPESVSSIHRFGAFELNLLTSELHHRGARVALAPQSLAVLTHLLTHRERTVSREELLSEVWRGVQVNEGALRQAIFELRQALGDDAEEPAIIKTVRTRGYRFVAEVESVAAPVAKPPLDSAPLARRSGAVFGREQELLRLTHARDASVAGAGRAFLLVGEPGIGKSRLARELVDRTPPDAALCFEVSADEAGSAPPFWPWLRVLRGSLEQASAGLRSRCEQIAPSALRAFVADPSEISCAESLFRAPVQQRFNYFDQLARVLVELSLQRPAVVVFEDLHWADEFSLAFLGHLAQLLPQTRLFLVLSCRPLPKRENRALARTIDALLRSPLNQRIELEPLDVAAIREMLDVNAAAVSLELAGEVHALTRGNPLFSLELARLLRSAGEEGRALLLQREHAEVLSVIRSRLAYLPEDCRPLLAAASVIGRDFSLGELASLLGCGAEAALGQVDVCVRAGILLPQGEVRFGFAHPLIQKAVYEDMQRVERSALHKRHAEALEQRGQDLSLARLHELAHHFYRGAVAGGAERAISYAVRCATRALEATGYESARMLYERALECTDLVPAYAPTDRLALELGRAEAMRASGASHVELNALFLELFERALALSAPELMARAALGFTGQLPVRFVPTRSWGGVDGQEIMLLERALQALGPARSELRVLLLCALGYALAYHPGWPRCERLFREALEAADELGTPWLIARVLLLQAYVCAAPGTLAQRRHAADRLVALTEQNGLWEIALEARLARAACAFSSLDVQGAARDVRSVAQLAQQIGSPGAEARGLVPEIWRAFMEGRLDDADSLSRRCAELAGDDVHHRNTWIMRRAAIEMLRAGVLSDSLSLYETMLESVPGAVGVHALLASTYATLGRIDEALRHFDIVAHADFAALPRGINWLTEMSLMADAAARLGDQARAQAVYAHLLPFADEFTFFGAEVCPGMPMSYWLGELATSLGEFQVAQDWFEKGEQACRALGAPMLLQYVALGRARLALMSEPTGSQDQARMLLQGVFAFAEARGIAWLRTCASSLEHDCAMLRKRRRPSGSRGGALRVVQALPKR